MSLGAKKRNAEMLNTILTFTMICYFLDLLLALPQQCSLLASDREF